MARTKDFDEEAVLNKAIAVFWDKGYNGTSMQELVDELGISRSSLYDTYVDKHMLYMKALEHYRHSGEQRLTDLLTRATSAKAAIKALIKMVAGDLLGDRQHRGCFMVNAEVEIASHDAEVNAIVQKNEEQIENTFRTLILKGQKNGEIANKQDARALARFFLNAVKGIRVSSKTTTDKSVFTDIIKTTMLVLN